MHVVADLRLAEQSVLDAAEGVAIAVEIVGVGRLDACLPETAAEEAHDIAKCRRIELVGQWVGAHREAALDDLRANQQCAIAIKDLPALNAQRLDDWAHV